MSRSTKLADLLKVLTKRICKLGLICSELFELIRYVGDFLRNLNSKENEENRTKFSQHISDIHFELDKYVKETKAVSEEFKSKFCLQIYF